MVPKPKHITTVFGVPTPATLSILLSWTQFALGPVAFADETRIIGEARVIDGDSLDVGPVRIRLHGIDVPAAGQRCGQEPGE